MVKRRYGPLPGHLSGAFAFASQTWVPTMTTITHSFWFWRSSYSLLCQDWRAYCVIHVTSIFATVANLEVPVLAKGSMFHSSLWVFACFHRRRTGSLATIIVLQAFCFKKKKKVFFYSSLKMLLRKITKRFSSFYYYVLYP